MMGGNLGNTFMVLIRADHINVSKFLKWMVHSTQWKATLDCPDNI